MGFALPAIALTAGQAATAAIATAAVSSALTYKAQQDSVKAAQAAQDANAAAASESAAAQYRGMIVSSLRDEAASQQEIDRVSREALKAESGAALAAVESGAGGGALADQIRNFQASALSYQTAMKRDLGYRRADTVLGMHAVSQEAKNRITTYRPSYESPSLLGAGLTIAGGFLDASRFGVPTRGATTVAPPKPYSPRTFGYGI